MTYTAGFGEGVRELRDAAQAVIDAMHARLNSGIKTPVKFSAPFGELNKLADAIAALNQPQGDPVAEAAVVLLGEADTASAIMALGDIQSQYIAALDAASERMRRALAGRAKAGDR